MKNSQLQRYIIVMQVKKNSKKHRPPKSIDLFRIGASFLIKENKLKQKDIAIKLNKLRASIKTAQTDLSDFLHGRKNYGMAKQEALAHILGYSHLEILKYGESLSNNKIKNLKEEKQLRKVMLKSGISYSMHTILKMVKEILLCDYETSQLEKSSFIEDIIKKWKALKVTQKLKNYHK